MDFKYLVCEFDAYRRSTYIYIHEDRGGLVWTNLECANLFVNIPAYPPKLFRSFYLNLRAYELVWTACWWSFDRLCGKLSLLQIYELMELFLIMINNESQKKPGVILRHMCLMSGVERVKTVKAEEKASW